MKNQKLNFRCYMSCNIWTRVFPISVVLLKTSTTHILIKIFKPFLSNSEFFRFLEFFVELLSLNIKNTNKIIKGLKISQTSTLTSNSIKIRQRVRSSALYTSSQTHSQVDRQTDRLSLRK